MVRSLEFLQVLFVSCYLYLARRQDIAQEMERNLETADFIAWPGSAWLLLSFSPFPVRHPVHGPGIVFVQRGASDHSQGFEDKNLGSSPGLLGQ